MLKNISNNVKCVKVRYAKDSTFLSLFLRCLFGLSWNYERVNGDNSTALFSLKYLFYIPNEQTQHSSDHTPVANKKVTVNTSSSSPNGSVQSYYIHAIFALEVKVGMRKTIPQEQTGSY